MQIAVIGLGLIGGSMALDLKEAGHEVFGFDRSGDHEEKAIQRNLIDKLIPLSALKQCDVVVVSIPVHHTAQMISNVLDLISDNTVVLDTASTKASICKQLATHPKRGQFVAAHPLAGTEHSGPSAALHNLFRGKKNIICEEELTSPEALEKAMSLFDELGMHCLFMNPEEHDRHLAYVSHLSHVSAFMLGTTVLDVEKDEKQIVNLASTGFESTVRLAKSSPETWSSIFKDNKENLLPVLEAYIEHLSRFKVALIEDNDEEIMNMIHRANDIKRVLNGMKFKGVKLS